MHIVWWESRHQKINTSKFIRNPVMQSGMIRNNRSPEFPGRFNVKKDKVVVAGKKTLEELTDYRNDIAHWWTDTIDENYLADLQRTINELTHRKYFKRSSVAVPVPTDIASE